MTATILFIPGRTAAGFQLGPLRVEDRNDHDDLRRGPLLAVLVGKQAPDGRGVRDRGCPADGEENVEPAATDAAGRDQRNRHQKIVYDRDQATGFSWRYSWGGASEHPGRDRAGCKRDRRPDPMYQCLGISRLKTGAGGVGPPISVWKAG
jgi:hypothetical protein